MPEIEIPDAPDAPEEAPRSGGPYGNLVPLVVIPALIVMVVVLIATFFGGITGKEATPAENIERLLHGGSNDRTQAAFNLVRQVLEDWQAEAASGETVWGSGPELLPELRRAWDETSDMRSPDDVPIPLALSVLLAQLGDPDGVERLVEMTRLDVTLDPDGEYRAYAGFALGALGERLEPEQRRPAAQALIRMLDDPDEGLRVVAAIALQTLPTPETIPALEGLLTERSLELRGNAALSLAELGSDAGAAVLREMLAPEAYEAEHDRDRRKWSKRQRVSESRCKALEALVELGRAPAAAELDHMAREDADPALRELAQRLAARG